MSNASPTLKQIVDNFDAQAKKRAEELLEPTSNGASSSMRDLLDSMREDAFCLGYKAGVVDQSSSLRTLTAVYNAACAWQERARLLRTAPPSDVYEQQLIAAIDAARKKLA